MPCFSEGREQQTTAVHVRKPPPPSAPVPAPQAPPASATRLPDDFDPFADLPSPPPGPANAAMASFMSGSPNPAPAGALPADLGLGDLIGIPDTQAGSSLDAMFGLNAAPTPGSDPLASFLSAPKPGTAPGSQSESKDPLAMFGGASPAKRVGRHRRARYRRHLRF